MTVSIYLYIEHYLHFNGVCSLHFMSGVHPKRRSNHRKTHGAAVWRPAVNAEQQYSVAREAILRRHYRQSRVYVRSSTQRDQEDLRQQGYSRTRCKPTY